MIRIVGIEPGARKAQQYFFFGANARERAAHAWTTAPKEGGRALKESFSAWADVRIVEASEQVDTLSAVAIEAPTPAAVAPVATCPRGHLVVSARCTVCTWEASR